MTEKKTINLIDRAKQHFQPMRSNAKKIHVPEWGEGDDGVFYATAMNLKERQIIEKMSKDDIEMAVELLIRKLEDNDGNKVFNRGDKQDLMTKVDPAVIGRVAAEVLGENVDMEEAEKN